MNVLNVKYLLNYKYMYINDVHINNKLYICISKGRKDMRNTPEDKNKLKI
jgi:hypothetical protein